MKSNIGDSMSKEEHMKEKFSINYKILLLGILKSCYPLEILAYAYDIPQEQIETILDYLHQGARKATVDSIRILIKEQGLTTDNISELFPSMGLSKETTEMFINSALEDSETDKPDLSSSEINAAAFRTGYIHMSGCLFHDLKVISKSPIEEINALFDMNPDMDQYVSNMCRIADEVKLERKLYGEYTMDEGYGLLEYFLGPVITNRLREYRHVAEFCRELRKLPEDIRDIAGDIYTKKIFRMIESQASFEEIKDALIDAFKDAGIYDEIIKHWRLSNLKC